MSMALFGVALFWVSNDPGHPQPYFYWGLALMNPEGDERWASKNEMDVYKVVRDDTKPGGWKRHFTIMTGQPPASFAGIVEFTTLLTYEELSGFICDVPTSGTPSVQGPTGWTCAAWCLSIIASLNDADYVSLPCDADRLYRRIIAKGYDLLQMRMDTSYRTQFPVVSIG
ncbi:hypothetical protein BDP27DRAFT_173124 [Rhodocollybia butyracea]|uniref:Uncharacterized protein n=1 Tax=Rhodocollybia butyracea TaxID=206335 RepID=A0A9P5PI16_9AGAR|nr:hypothetical protein BDP27DRAFT_173124 [Rhodocollybia butyracea]